MFDYRDFVSKYSIPTVSHEIGQWCVYPDFKEIAKYTGVLKPRTLRFSVKHSQRTIWVIRQKTS